MPMERRGARDVAQTRRASSAHAEGPFKGYAKLDWIHSAAATRPDERFTSLVHHFNGPNLRRAFQELDGSKASGVDRVTKDQYRKNLDTNIEALAKALREGSYRPRPSR